MASVSTFHFSNFESAIRFHISKRLMALGWQSMSDPGLASFNDSNLTLDNEVSKVLEYKHLLAALSSEFAPTLMPETFYVDDHNWQSIVGYMEHHQLIGPWILKPSMLNNGDHIVLLKHTDALKEHYLSMNRLGGPHVLQRYVHPPHLLQGKKYTYRLSVILTNDSGVFVAPHGYVNISKNPYPGLSFVSRNDHITNYILDGELAGIRQLSTTELTGWGELRAVFCEHIQTMVRAITSVFPHYLSKKDVHGKPRPRAFELFGFDFMLSEDKQVWLLEINHGPDFPMTDDHALKDTLWDPFWQHVMDDFVLPNANQKPYSNHYFTRMMSPNQCRPSWLAKRKGRSFLAQFRPILQAY